MEDRLHVFQYLSQFLTAERLIAFDRILRNRTRYLTVVVEDLHKSQNASAVARTCEIMGIQDLHVIEGANRYKLKRDIAVGAEKWLDIYRYRGHESNTKACLHTLREKGYQVVAAVPDRQAVPLDTFEINVPTAICIGGELEGLSKTILEAADAFLTIPMQGMTRSYNLSVSTGIILYDLVRALRENSQVDWELSDSEKLEKKIEWAIQTIPKGRGPRYLRYYQEQLRSPG